MDIDKAFRESMGILGTSTASAPSEKTSISYADVVAMIDALPEPPPRPSVRCGDIAKFKSALDVAGFSGRVDVGPKMLAGSLETYCGIDVAVDERIPEDKAVMMLNGEVVGIIDLKAKTQGEDT